jgi:hypothetical protein
MYSDVIHMPAATAGANASAATATPAFTDAQNWNPLNAVGVRRALLQYMLPPPPSPAPPPALPCCYADSHTAAATAASCVYLAPTL